MLFTEATRMKLFIQLAFKHLFLRVKFVFKVRMSAYSFTLGKDFVDGKNRKSNVKSYENLDTYGGNSTLFQCKKPPNSRKAYTVVNLLCVMKYMRTTKFNEKIKGSQNHEMSYYE